MCRFDASLLLVIFVALGKKMIDDSKEIDVVQMLVPVM